MNIITSIIQWFLSFFAKKELVDPVLIKKNKELEDSLNNTWDEAEAEITRILYPKDGKDAK